MKCYYHEKLDAVGTCKSCSKGLCRECAIDLGKGLACEGCRQDVVDLITTIDRNIKIGTNYKNIKKNGMVQFGFMGILGGVFLCTGIYYYETFSIVMGACFMLYAGYILWRTIKFPKIEK